MMKMDSLAPLSIHRPAWVSLLIAILFTIGGILFIGPLLGFLALIPYLEMDPSSIESQINDMFLNPSEHPEARTGVLLMQGLNSVGAFIIAPMLYLIIADKVHPKAFFNARQLKIAAVLLCVVLTFMFMQVNGLFIEWNAGLTLPEGLAPVEAWMKNTEETAAKMTAFLTDFSSPGYFILTILVLAVIPAVGEELLFRGVFQNLFSKQFGNIHMGIWTSAFLFSAVHFQFYGFVPRLLLGALFGYLYLWSGSLTYAMIAHFLNNFLTLVALYMVQKGLIEVDFSATETLPIGSILISALVGIVATVYFRKQFMMKDRTNGWEVVFRSPEEYRAQMVSNILEEKGLKPVMVNKKESAYGVTGEYEISVNQGEAGQALQIIENDIKL